MVLLVLSMPQPQGVELMVAKGQLQQNEVP